MNFYEYYTEEVGLIDEVMNFMSKRKYKKALECINNSSSDEINDPLVIMSKGQCYLRLGDRRNANRCYKKAIAVCDEKLSETKDTITLNIKGNCNLLLKNYIEAIECYNEVLDTDEKNSLALSFKSVALIRLDETDAAFDCLKKLSEIDSDNNDVKLFKVQYFNSIGKYEKSLKLLREVIESPYDYPQAYMLRADVFVELGKFVGTAGSIVSWACKVISITGLGNPCEYVTKALVNSIGSAPKARFEITQYMQKDASCPYPPNSLQCSQPPYAYKKTTYRRVA